MNRVPSRVVLALVLFVSAALFVAGSIAEHHLSSSKLQRSEAGPAQESPTAKALTSATNSQRPRSSPSPTASKKVTSGSGEGSTSHEAAEHHQSAPSPRPTRTVLKSRSIAPASPSQVSTPAEGSASREAAERAAGVPNSERIFGLDLEQPWIVAAGALLLLALGVLALSFPRRAVLWGIGALALAFAVFDVREAFHQASESKTSLLVIASVLATMHFGAAVIASSSARRHRETDLISD